MPEKPDNIVPLTGNAKRAAQEFGAEHDRELLTILFTDLVDSTKLQSDLGNVEAARLTERHRKIVRDALAKFDAREIEWAGDSCLAVFSKPSDGVVFALKLQAALRSARESEPNMSAVRIGLHLGEIVVRHRDDGGKRSEDLFGLQVSEAARVMSLARGDQIYCTRAVFDNARSSLKGHPIEGLGEIQWLRHGFFELKGSDELVEVGEVGEVGHAPLRAPEANDKCRPFKGDPEKWRKRRAKGAQSRRGIPAAAVVGITVGAVMVGLLAGIGFGRRTVPPALTDARIHSLAVLPSKSVSADGSEGDFTEFLTMEVTNALQGIDSINVMGFSNALYYKDSDLSPVQIASELDVDAAVQVFASLNGDQLTVSAEVFKSPTGDQIGHYSDQRAVKDFYRLQGDLALDIAKAIEAVLTPEETARLADKREVDPAALDAYRTAWFLAFTGPMTRERIDEAEAYFKKAIAADAGFAEAYTDLARVYVLRPGLGMADSMTNHPIAREYAKRALAIDSLQGGAEAVLGHVAASAQEWDEAAAHFRLARQKDPEDFMVLWYYMMYLKWLGRHQELIELTEHVLTLHSDNLLLKRQAAESFVYAGAPERGLRIIEEVRNENPDFMLAYDTLIKAHLLVGQYEDSRKLATSAQSKFPDALAYWRLREANALAREGDIEGGREIIEDVISRSEDVANFKTFVAESFCELGDLDSAFTWLNEALAVNEPFLVGNIREYGEAYPVLAQDSHYWDLIERMNFPPLPPEHPLYEKELDWKLTKKAEERLAEQPPIRYTIDPPPDAPLAGRGGREAVLTPDGRTVVYVAVGEDGRLLYKRDLASLEAEPIPGTEDATSPFVSPDSRNIGFFTDTGVLKVVPLAGGPVVTVYDFDGIAAGASWMPDGRIVATPRWSMYGLAVIDPGAPGEPEILTEVDVENGEVGHGWPHVLPDGDTVLFTAMPESGPEDARIERYSLKTKERNVVLEHGAYPVYSQTGHLLYGHLGRLMAAPFDAETLTVTGQPAIVQDTIVTRIGGAAEFDIARDGTLIYVPAVGQGSLRELAWVEFDGNREPLAALPAIYYSPRLSPDGETVAVEVRTAGATQIWLLDAVRGAPRKLTSESGLEFSPAWSRDGSELAFGRRWQQRGIGIVAVDEDAPIEELQPTDTATFYASPYGWTSDGKTIVYTTRYAAGGMGIMKYTRGDAESTPVLVTTFPEDGPALSPDDRWLAYHSEFDATGQRQVYVRSFVDGGAPIPVSIQGGIWPTWAPDGNAIFYTQGQSMMRVPVLDPDRMRLGQPEPLFTDQFDSAVLYRQYDISPDGERFLMLFSGGEQGHGAQIVVVKNWANELKRLVPAPEAN